MLCYQASVHETIPVPGAKHLVVKFDSDMFLMVPATTLV